MSLGGTINILGSKGLINHLKKGKNKNILFQSLLRKFKDDSDQNYDLNIK